MTSQNIALTEQQQALVDQGLEENGVLLEFAIYIGQTELGEHTYFFHTTSSSWGYVVLPIGSSNGVAGLDLERSVISVGSREFDMATGAEVLFSYLVHTDLRKTQLGAGRMGSFLPEHAAERLGVTEKEPEWVGHTWLDPWDLTTEVIVAAVAITLVFPDRRKVVIL